MMHETTHYRAADGTHFTVTAGEDRPGNDQWIFSNWADDPTIFPYGMVIRSTADHDAWIRHLGAKEILPVVDPRFDGAYIHPDGTRITITAKIDGSTIDGISPKGGRFSITIWDVAAYIAIHNLTRVTAGDPSRAGIYDSGDGVTATVTAADNGYRVDEGGRWILIYDLDAYLSLHNLTPRVRDIEEREQEMIEAAADARIRRDVGPQY